MTEAQEALNEGWLVNLDPAEANVAPAPQKLDPEVFGDDELGRASTILAERRPVVGGAPAPHETLPATGRGAATSWPNGSPSDDEILQANFRDLAAEEPDARVTVEDGESVRMLPSRL